MTMIVSKDFKLAHLKEIGAYTMLTSLVSTLKALTKITSPRGSPSSSMQDLKSGRPIVGITISKSVLAEALIV